MKTKYIQSKDTGTTVVFERGDISFIYKFGYLIYKPYICPIMDFKGVSKVKGDDVFDAKIGFDLAKSKAIKARNAFIRNTVIKNIAAYNHFIRIIHTKGFRKSLSGYLIDNNYDLNFNTYIKDYPKMIPDGITYDNAEHIHDLANIILMAYGKVCPNCEISIFNLFKRNSQIVKYCDRRICTWIHGKVERCPSDNFIIKTGWSLARKRFFSKLYYKTDSIIRSLNNILVKSKEDIINNYNRWVDKNIISPVEKITEHESKIEFNSGRKASKQGSSKQT